MTTLRVVFESPGWFLTDAHLTVAIDGDEIYSGSFGSGRDAGFDITVETWPGTHRIYTKIDNGLIERRRAYPIEVRHRRAQTIHLDYSRMWGNFARSVEVQPA